MNGFIFFILRFYGLYLKEILEESV